MAILTAKQFEQSDLETLAQMGVTTDRSGRLRIGHAVAKEMGLGGGRWLKREEEAKVPDSVKGYGVLPSGVRERMEFSTIERFHLAAEAGANGIPEVSGEYVTMLKTLEDAVASSSSKNGNVENDGLLHGSIEERYWNHNLAQTEKGYAPETPKQFLEGLAKGVEKVLKDAETAWMKQTKTAKEMVMADPRKALGAAVNADYLITRVIATTVKALADSFADVVGGQSALGKGEYAAERRPLMPSSR